MSQGHWVMSRDIVWRLQPWPGVVGTVGSGGRGPGMGETFLHSQEGSLQRLSGRKCQ